MQADNRQCGRAEDRDRADPCFSCVPVHLILPSLLTSQAVRLKRQRVQVLEIRRNFYTHWEHCANCIHVSNRERLVDSRSEAIVRKLFSRGWLKHASARAESRKRSHLECGMQSL